MSFIDFIEKKDAAAFRDAMNAALADKTFTALEAEKVEVAKKFFNTTVEASEEVETVGEAAEKKKTEKKAKKSTWKPSPFSKSSCGTLAMARRSSAKKSSQAW